MRLDIPELRIGVTQHPFSEGSAELPEPRFGILAALVTNGRERHR